MERLIASGEVSVIIIGIDPAAIRLFCLECMGGSPAEIDACTAPECPLYSHRSGRRPAPQKEEQK